jgi:predicted phage terminase large subunit-like protein
VRLAIKDLAERRSFLDPHGGKGGTVRSGLARAAITDLARDRWNRYWVLDTWAGRVGTEEMIDKIVEHYHKWSPAQFGVDATAQQTLFVDTIQPFLRLRGERIAIIGISTHVDKIYRIRTVLQPIIAEHRLFVNDDALELRAEMASFPTGKTVDILDSLANCITMFPVVASSVEDQEAGDDMYAEFLREQGLPEDEIRARLKEQD